jgi:FkbM family methyltransferase
MLQTILGRFGIYYSKRQFMPRGIEWLWDLARLTPAVTVRTVIDVGANEGQTARAILRAFPGAAVHAFEPVQGTFDVLRQAHGADPRVRLNRLVVSSEAGVAWVQAESSSLNSHVVPATAAGGARVESVDAVTLDDYCAQHDIARIDILKTDTEGHDLQVMKGARNLLAAGKIEWVLVEVTFNPNDAVISLFGPIHDFLAEHGMAPWCFYDHCHTEADRNLLFCNVLFVRRAAVATIAQGPQDVPL